VAANQLKIFQWRKEDMKKIRRILGLVATVMFALTLTAGFRPIWAVGAGDKPARGAAVKIDNFSFGPADVTISAGTTITWTNHDDVPHVVASEDKLFKSKALDTDDHFSFTFSKPGTYTYYCSIHPKMTAKVVVQ
jgi:plastocyanin